MTIFFNYQNEVMLATLKSHFLYLLKQRLYLSFVLMFLIAFF